MNKTKNRKFRIKPLLPLLFVLSPFFATIITYLIMGIFNIHSVDLGSYNFSFFILLTAIIVLLISAPIILIVGLALTAIIHKIKKGSTLEQTQAVGFCIPAIVVCAYAVIDIVNHPFWY